VKDGKVVKGTKFKNLLDIGNPVELAKAYYEAGADEITFLDVSASLEGGKAILEVISETAESIFIPLTVGGGVKTIEDVEDYLAAGADKVSIGSASVSNPDLLDEIARKYGNQILVVSLDIIEDPNVPSGYALTTMGGTNLTGIDAIKWIVENQDRGIGELLINSVDADGTKSGFNIPLLQAIKVVTHLPLIASGGAGSAEDFVTAAKSGANAVLAASIFHNGEVSIMDVKNTLHANGVKVRM